MQIIDLLDPSRGSEMVASGGADLVDLRDLKGQQPMLTVWPRNHRGSKGGIHPHLGLSENRVYSQWNSHLVGIMIINHWVQWGTQHFQTNPFLSPPISTRVPKHSGPPAASFPSSCGPHRSSDLGARKARPNFGQTLHVTGPTHHLSSRRSWWVLQTHPGLCVCNGLALRFIGFTKGTSVLCTCICRCKWHVHVHAYLCVWVRKSTINHKSM